MPLSFLVASLNVTEEALRKYPRNQTLSMYGPELPIPWFNSESCSALTSAVFPSNGGVFLNYEAAEASRSTWLGVWVAFFTLFCIVTPIIGLAAWRIYRPKKKAPLAGTADD